MNGSTCNHSHCPSFLIHISSTIFLKFLPFRKRTTADTMDRQVSSTRVHSAYSRRISVIFCLGISAFWDYSYTFAILPSRLPNSSDRRRWSQRNAERLSDSALSFLRPPAPCNVDQMSATDLAYVGDVVYELYVRSRTVWPPKRTADVQQQAVALVRGKEVCLF